MFVDFSVRETHFAKPRLCALCSEVNYMHVEGSVSTHLPPAVTYCKTWQRTSYLDQLITSSKMQKTKLSPGSFR